MSFWYALNTNIYMSLCMSQRPSGSGLQQAFHHQTVLEKLLHLCCRSTIIVINTMMIISSCMLPEITGTVKCVAKTTQRVSLMDGRGTYVGFFTELCVSSTNEENIKSDNELVFLRKYGFTLCANQFILQSSSSKTIKELESMFFGTLRINQIDKKYAGWNNPVLTV